ncbi:MAG: type II secretion system major pseudopilin GspG [Gammaproteobacteria bacterium]|nr:type II secretion system major pseudopilin GspG [Gammaproteobacteria bacterium]
MCFRNRAKGREKGREKRRAKGFSLIELMIVLVILGLLAALVGPELMKRLEGSKVDVANTQVKMLRSALQTYRIDIGAYPVTAQGLAALMAPPDEVAEYWRGPYLQDELPDDPWRNPYQYEAPVDNLQGFFLYSFGADGARGGEGDNADIGYPPEGSP